MTSDSSIGSSSSVTVFADVRAAEKAAGLERNALAAKAVASHALDVADCVHLLAMLGLDLPEST